MFPCNPDVVRARHLTLMNAAQLTEFHKTGRGRSCSAGKMRPAGLFFQSPPMQQPPALKRMNLIDAGNAPDSDALLFEPISNVLITPVVAASANGRAVVQSRQLAFQSVRNNSRTSRRS